MWRLKQLLISFKNLLIWLPIIWKDRDWDHTFIYDIIEFKLRKQSKHIGKLSIHGSAGKNARDMLICANLIDKIKNGYYGLEYFDYHKSEMVFLDIEDKPGFVELEINTISESFDTYFKKYPIWYKRAIKHIKENQDRFTTDHNDSNLIAMIMGDLREVRARELLFNIMNNQIESWWN